MKMKIKIEIGIEIENEEKRGEYLHQKKNPRLRPLPRRQRTKEGKEHLLGLRNSLASSLTSVLLHFPIPHLSSESKDRPRRKRN